VERSPKRQTTRNFPSEIGVSNPPFLNRVYSAPNQLLIVDPLDARESPPSDASPARSPIQYWLLDLRLLRVA